jgi:hypothetical protein
MEAWSRVREVKTSKRGNAMRGSVGGTSGNTDPTDTDFPIAQFLGAAARCSSFRLADYPSFSKNGMKDRAIARCSPLPGRENL